jgi:ATP-dependent DNA ligase
MWLHEIEHDGFRVIARKDGTQVRLYSRPGNDLTYRFPLIVKTLARLRPRSCIIDGEAVVRDGDGTVSVDHIRYRRHDSSAFLAFDLIELTVTIYKAIRSKSARTPWRISWRGQDMDAFLLIRADELIE